MIIDQPNDNYIRPSWSGVGAFQKYNIYMGFSHWAKTGHFFKWWGGRGGGDRPFALSASDPALTIKWEVNQVSKRHI